MVDTPELPDERSITTSSGETVTVRETIDDVTVSATRKKQLDQYEPVSEHVSLTASKPAELHGIDPDCSLSREQFDAWLEGLADIAWKEAERGVATRYESYVRDIASGD